MATMKMAISIDKTVFHRIDRLTRKLHISRSRFFSQAGQYMLEKDENLELLKKINSAFDAPPDEQEKALRKQEKRYGKRRVADKW